MKIKTYTGGNLLGTYCVSRKIDGVRAEIDAANGTVLSRAGKPLYNFDGVLLANPHLKGTFEVFRDGYDATISLVRTQANGSSPVELSDLYILSPTIDPRLYVTHFTDPDEETITNTFLEQVSAGYEGLVLKEVNTHVMWKYKPSITYDLVVLGVKEGTGAKSGMLGAFQTTLGWVGTGMTDTERIAFWNDDRFIGSVCECSCMEMTRYGKMRHSRFERLRFDKSAEESDGQ